MKFSRGQAVSFKVADDGVYLGVIVGFSYVGMHQTKDWGAKPKVMLRWELHETEPPFNPCVDDEDLIYVVTQNFSATIGGEQSWLYKCLLAHGIAVPGGSCTDSKDWYGKAAELTIKSVEASKAGKLFMNLTDIVKLDHDVKIVPVLKYEHWEADDEAPPPTWAKSMIDKSSDIYQRVAVAKSATPAARPGPAASQGNYQPPMAPAGGYRAPMDDDEDIPFNYMIIPSNEDSEGYRSWIGIKPASSVVK